MQTPLQITFRGIERSDSIEAQIRSKAEGLERFAADITSCHVIVEAEHHRHHKGNGFDVQVNVRLPGHEIAARGSQARGSVADDLHAAVRDAFDAASRQLDDHLRRRRGEVK